MVWTAVCGGRNGGVSGGVVVVVVNVGGCGADNVAGERLHTCELDDCTCRCRGHRCDGLKKMRKNDAWHSLKKKTEKK